MRVRRFLTAGAAGEGVDVSTATTLTQFGFYVGTPNAATSLKYLIYDATANALVYTQTEDARGRDGGQHARAE